VLSPLIRFALVEYRGALTRRFGDRLRFVRLFGSWARGQATEDSDIDVAVVIDALSPADWKAAHADAAEVSVSADLGLSALVLSSDRYDALLHSGGIAREIERDGISP
jgi:predicted nucleotidyltransferase